MNSVFLAMLGWVYHRFSSHDYPHLPTPAPVNVHETSDPPPLARDFEAQDIDAALAQFHESYDIQRGDLELLLRAAEKRRLSRRFAPTTCAQIMSREALCVEQHMAMARARETFGLRALWRAPVIDSEGVVVGMLTPIGLVTGAKSVGAAMSPAICVAPETLLWT